MRTVHAMHAMHIPLHITHLCKLVLCTIGLHSISTVKFSISVYMFQTKRGILTKLFQTDWNFGQYHWLMSSSKIQCWFYNLFEHTKLIRNILMSFLMRFPVKLIRKLIRNPLISLLYCSVCIKNTRYKMPFTQVPLMSFQTHLWWVWGSTRDALINFKINWYIGPTVLIIQWLNK